MKLKTNSIFVSGLIVLLMPLLGQAAPKLVLQITVDQLRGDLPFRHQQHYGAGGFQYLMEQGIWYRNAHHPQANTETIVGHSNLATGTTPSGHGMIGNVWFDRSLNRLVYNVEDSRYGLVGEAGSRSKKAEQDPSQVAKSEGRSPGNILGSTISDEIARKGNGVAKIFSIAGKDRAAVAMAGHQGKAFWYSQASGDFISSTFYYSQYPNWVINWNAQKLADSYAGKSWRLTKPLSAYTMGEQDDRAYESNLPIYGNTFPHAFGPTPAQDSEKGGYFYMFLMSSPVVDELTVDFAKQLIEYEEIGQDNVTDYLAVGLSVTDYIGHFFGPSSLEQEDNLLRLDRSLADLLRIVDKKIGLDNTLIILSADHGSPDIPAYAQEQGLEAGVIPVKEIETTIKKSLKHHYPASEDLLLKYYHPYVYLNRAVIAERKLQQVDVERNLAKDLQSLQGIALAVSSSDIISGNVPDDKVHQQIILNHHPDRSGDIYLAWAEHWSPVESIEVVNHSSPWHYDTHVPLVFAGMSLKAASIDRPVSVLDSVPTISHLITIETPSLASTKPLVEVSQAIK